MCFEIKVASMCNFLFGVHIIHMNVLLSISYTISNSITINSEMVVSTHFFLLILLLLLSTLLSHKGDDSVRNGAT